MAEGEVMAKRLLPHRFKTRRVAEKFRFGFGSTRHVDSAGDRLTSKYDIVRLTSGMYAFQRKKNWGKK